MVYILEGYEGRQPGARGQTAEAAGPGMRVRQLARPG